MKDPNCSPSGKARIIRNRPWHIIIVSFIFNRMVNLLFGLGIKDTQCGFKIFKTSSAKEIISKLIVYSNPQIIKGSAVSAGFDMEFLFIAKKLGYKIKEISVSWKHVETKHVNFFKDSFDALKDIFKIRRLDFKKKYDFKK